MESTYVGKEQPLGPQTGFCSLSSAQLRGMEAMPVRVEVSIEDGLPRMTFSGMPDVEVIEARWRVRAALRSSGFSEPRKRIHVNLAPSELRKTGGDYDLAIAVGILVASGQIPPSAAEGRLFVGGLEVDGAVRPARGGVLHAALAESEGLALVGAFAGDDALIVKGAELLGMAQLGDIRMPKLDKVEPASPRRCPQPADFSDIPGCEAEKRALQIAAAGGHSILLMDCSYAAGLAQRLPTILPQLADGELEEAVAIRSAAGLPSGDLLSGLRPFRPVRHSMTLAGLLGGGREPLPGEASLAHGGVLFLEDVSETEPTLLDALRQPKEAGAVHIVRAGGIYSFPARFILAAGATTCTCPPEAPCTCSHRKRLLATSQRLFDIFAGPGSHSSPGLLVLEGPSSSAEMLEGVVRAREFAARRAEQGDQGPQTRATGEAQALLGSLTKDPALKSRCLLIARTIADLGESEQVDAIHVAEASSLLPRL